MDEKIMVNDILEDIKSNLLSYQDTISETENIKLRQLFQEIRDTNESFQYELFKIAKSKKYYNCPKETTTTEIENLKNELQE